MCCSLRGRQELITQWCLNCRIRPVWLLLWESESAYCSGSLLSVVLVAGEGNAKCRLKPGFREKRPRYLWTNNRESVKPCSFFLKQLKGCMTSQVPVLELCSLCLNFRVGKLPDVVCVCGVGTQIVLEAAACASGVQLGDLSENCLLSTDLNTAKV